MVSHLLLSEPVPTGATIGLCSPGGLGETSRRDCSASIPSSAPFSSRFGVNSKPSQLDQNFPRTHRLRKRWEFLQVQGSGKRFHTPHFVLMVEMGHEQKLGVTVSKRVSKHAVVRNYVRRCVREVFRGNRHSFPMGSTVVVAKPGAEKLRFAGIEGELLHATRRARAATATAVNPSGGGGQA